MDKSLVAVQVLYPREAPEPRQSTESPKLCLMIEQSIMVAQDPARVYHTVRPQASSLTRSVYIHMRPLQARVPWITLW